mmetsp:Transcript_6595/g.10404  ORF Transcript_6595/g.10404 Transcript_6595/m.10404 type:complete len:100 (-) Transcript_6595:1036-1335(-)
MPPLSPWLPSTGHVHAYISGHDHAVAWYKPDDGTVEYFLSGAGSATNRGMFLQDTGLKFYNGQVGAFASISASNKHLRVQLIDHNGNMLLLGRSKYELV